MRVVDKVNRSHMNKKMLCINNKGCERLFTIGKIYVIDKMYKTKPEYFVNECDNGWSNFACKECFIGVKEYRRKKLEKLGL